MKATFFTLIFSILLKGIVGQCLSNGISTNPTNPSNSQLPSKTNLYFDWRQQYYNNNNTCQPLSSVESPFYKVDNLELLRAAKDMQPEDGWELLRRDLGYTDQNALKPDVPEHTYFILYNKYSGLLRILLKTCRGADYNGMKITLKFDETSSFQTSLLDMNNIVKALDETFSSNPAKQSAAVFVNDRTKWFYADFPMNYDPCTCKYKSKLKVMSNLIQNSTITINGSIGGTITSITNGQGSVNSNGSNSLKDLTSIADKFAKVYGSVDEFITQTKNIAVTLPGNSSANVLADYETFRTQLKSLQFIKTGLAVAPWLKSISGLFDLFVGGGRSAPQLTQLMPLSVNLSLSATGTMQTSNQYHNISFSNPGSLDAQNDPDIYPFYNESLGVFNLISGPKFKVLHNQGTLSTRPPVDMERWRIQLKEQMKWVLNPASGLTFHDAQAAFVAESFETGTTPPASIGQKFDFLEARDPQTNRWEYRTEYVDFNCLSLSQSFYFTARENSTVNRIPDRFYLKLMVNLERPNGQNVLLILKYPINDNDYSNVSYQEIYNGQGTTFDPTTCGGGAFAQATATEINNFCSSTTYQNNRNMRVANNNLDTLGSNKSSAIYKIYPNPTSNAITISGNTEKDPIKDVQILDITGKITKHFSTTLQNQFSQTIDISNLQNGTYILKVLHNTGYLQTFKISVIH